MATYFYFEDVYARIERVVKFLPSNRTLAFAEQVEPRTFEAARKALRSAAGRVGMLLDLNMPELGKCLPVEWDLWHKELGPSWENGVGFLIDALANQHINELVVFVVSGVAPQLLDPLIAMATRHGGMRCRMFQGFAPNTDGTAQDLTERFFKQCDSLWQLPSLFEAAIVSYLRPLSTLQSDWRHDNVSRLVGALLDDLAAVPSLRGFLRQESLPSDGDLKALFMTTDQGGWYKGGEKPTVVQRPLSGRTVRELLGRLEVSPDLVEVPADLCLPTIPGLPFLLALARFVHSLGDDGREPSPIKFGPAGRHGQQLEFSAIDSAKLLDRWRSKIEAGELNGTSLRWDQLQRSALDDKLVSSAVACLPSPPPQANFFRGLPGHGEFSLGGPLFTVTDSTPLTLTWSKL